MMTTPEDGRKTVRYIHDFETCANLDELKRLIYQLNCSGGQVVGVSQDQNGVYTVIFRRVVHG